MDLNWDIYIVPVFFFYGLAFYSMGFALLLESGRASELGFARSMRLLSGFGLLHGTHEWLEFLERSLNLYDGLTLPVWVQWLSVAFLAASFIALAAFGEHLRSLDRKDKMRVHLLILAVAWYAGSCVAVRVFNNLTDESWLAICDVLSRYILGMPASLLAAVVLYRQRHMILDNHMRRFTINFTVAAGFMLIYGLVGQIFVKETIIFPSPIINQNTFIDIFGFPVQVLRAITAIVLAISLISALRVLEIESQQRLKAIDDARRESEQRNRDELARLNATLRESESEARQLLRELKKRDTLRTEFLQQVTAAQESERKRIARELHDGTGQMLTGLALGLRGLSMQVHSHPELVIKRLSDLEIMATTTIGELRALIQDLRPPQLDDMGLIPAIRSMLDRFNEKHRPQFKLKITGTPYALESDVETILFRIVQEGITNITKHAQAEHACICLNYEDGVGICICDDGIGCDPNNVLNTTGPHTAWGLMGIEERVNLINAVWTFESEANKGTKLSVKLPDIRIKKEDQHAS